MLRVKRIYEKAEPSDGERILVDRVWPRGISKEAAQLSWWAKDVGPSTELRKWFGHQPERFEEFARRYRLELESNADLDRLRERVAAGDVTLVYSAKDETHNQARVLEALLTDG